MEKITAYCGLICSDCPVYTATLTNDDALRAKLAAEFSTDTFKLTKDDMNCLGCFSKSGANEKMCAGCSIRLCGMERRVENCGKCSHYPCFRIEDCVPRDSANRKTLDAIAKK